MSEEPPATDYGTALTYEVTSDETPSDAVVAAVAVASDTEPASMDPLAEFIDPDALDALFADQYDGTTRTGGQVRFPFFGHEVLVTGAGHVTVVALDQ
jgi:hypothetical protein